MTTSTALKIDQDWSFLTKDQFILNLSKSTLLECLDEYSNSRGKNCPSVVLAINSLRHNLVILENALRITLRTEQITSVFYDKFISFLQMRGVRLSTINNYVSLLARILDWCSKFQAVVHPSYKDINIPKYRIQMIALSADDVSRIYHFDISSLNIRNRNARDVLQRVKDTFVLSCSLGQRYSDMCRITHDNFSLGEFIIVQQKTKNKAVVDLGRFVLDKKICQEILIKYAYHAPYSGDISSYNKHLHQLMKYIFEDEMCEPTIITGSMVATKQVTKASQISSHTARRTFATHNYIVRRYPAYDVMKATGHTTESSFKHYIFDDED